MRVLRELSGGVLDLSEHRAFAAGSEVDLMTHVVSAIGAHAHVALMPGGWWGVRVGCVNDARIRWDASGEAELACLCIPSVRNGHLTESMLSFLHGANAHLLNFNLYPTMSAPDRKRVAEQLSPLLDRSLLSISFSRGFGMMFVHKEHPYLARFETAWRWLNCFHNAIAA